MSLLDVYRTQIAVLREWRGGPAALIKRLIIVLVVSVIAFLVTEWLVPSIVMLRPIGAVEIVVVMAVLNALIRPVLLAVVAPRSLVWTGILVLVFQVAVFFVAANIAPDVQVNAPGRRHRLVHLRDRQRRADIDLRRGHVRLVLRPARPAAAREARDPAQRQARARDRPDRRPRPPDPRGPRPGRVRQHHGPLDARREPPALEVGGDPAVDDVRQPGGHPPRQQRRHPGLPLVRAGPPAAHGLEQPGQRRRDRAPGVERRGPAVERRRQHLQPRDRRRDAVVPHDGGARGGLAGLGQSKAFMGFFFSPTGYLRSFTLFLGEFLKERYQARRTRRSGLVPQMHRGSSTRACGPRATCSSATSTSR